MGSETSGKGFINSGRTAEISHKPAFFVVPLPLKMKSMKWIRLLMDWLLMDCYGSREINKENLPM